MRVLISNECHTAGDLRAVPARTWRQIAEKLEQGVAGKPLKGPLAGLWSLRVADYRAVYEQRDGYAIVIAVGHRRGAYDDALLDKRRTG